MPPETDSLEPAAIGELEAYVLRLVKSVGRGSVSDILQAARRERRIAYTTISTTLDRLHRKGLVEREKASGKGGQHYVYSDPLDSAVQKEIIARTVDRLVTAFGSSAVSSIYERLDELSAGEVEELRRLVEKKKSE